MVGPVVHGQQGCADRRARESCGPSRSSGRDPPARPSRPRMYRSSVSTKTLSGPRVHHRGTAVRTTTTRCSRPTRNWRTRRSNSESEASRSSSSTESTACPEPKRPRPLVRPSSVRSVSGMRPHERKRQTYCVDARRGYRSDRVRGRQLHARFHATRGARRNGAVETVLPTARPKRELVKSHPIPRPPTVISAARQPLKRDLRASVPRQTWLELVRERDSRVHTSRPLQIVGGTTPLLRTSRPTCGSTRRGTDRST